MRTFEEYKRAVAEQPSDRLAEELIVAAKADGYDAWQIAELAGIRTELWA